MNEGDQQHNRTVSDRLTLLRSHLQIVHDGIVVAAAALHGQNADRDREIARVLEHLVGERLMDQIERISQLLALLAASGSRPGNIDGGVEEGGAPRGVREPQVLYLWQPGGSRKVA